MSSASSQYPSPSTHTLRIALAPSDTVGTAWHAARSVDAPATVGALTLGPTAFAHRIATFVGHPLSVAFAAERIAAADRILSELDDGAQWFSATRIADPVGAAQWLVNAHDTLRSSGWDGRPLQASPRLKAISALQVGTANTRLPPGFADALHDLVGTLQSRSLSVPVHVQLQAPRGAFSPLLGSLLAAIEARGHTVSAPGAADPGAAEDTDLGRLQRALRGGEKATLLHDGTLRILQGDSPWEAAALATALTGDDALWLLSGESALLDRVRSRFDRPLLGGGDSSCWRPALQILPLALALQTGPQDPQTALELLTLPVSPLPQRLRRALVGALGRQPAVGSPSWSEVLQEGLAKHAERNPDANMDALTQRIATLFPVAPSNTVLVSQAIHVVETVGRWASTTGALSEDSVLRAAASAAADLARSLRRLPHDRALTRLELAQLHDLALGDGVATQAAAEAGAPPVAHAPDAVPTGVQDLVWFGVVAGNAEEGRGIGWTTTERAALRASSVALPEEGARRAIEQDGWLHAVGSAKSSLTLVTWTATGSGPTEPHPLLDLWTTRVSEGSLSRVTLTAKGFLKDGGAQCRNIPAAGDVVPVPLWRLPKGLVQTERRWSASSIEKLITCPMSWTFSYAAGLRPGATAALPDLRTMAGTFAHGLFEVVLFDPATPWDGLSPTQAQDHLHTAFDTRLPTEAAPLGLPNHVAFTARLRKQLGEAMAALVRQLKAGGWRPEAPEKDVGELQATFGGQQMSGSIDLLVRGPGGTRGVVDLKLGGANYRGETLRKGKSIQLALYAEAASEGASSLPPVAYFILQDGELLTTDDRAFPDATHIHGPGPGETLLDVKRAWNWSKDMVEEGLVLTRGAHVGDGLDAQALSELTGREPPVHPWADDKPSCRFCDAQRLCMFVRVGGAQ